MIVIITCVFFLGFFLGERSIESKVRGLMTLYEVMSLPPKDDNQDELKVSNIYSLIVNDLKEVFK